MSKRSDKDREQVEKAKPGFVPVGRARGSRKGPAAPVDGGTPDTPVLRAKAEELRARGESTDEAASTDSLLRKFLPNLASDEPRSQARKPVGEEPKPPASASVKGKPRILSVRPSQPPDSDEGVPPKDLQVVMDDDGQIGESS